MKKGLFLLSLIVTFYALGTVSASAVTNDTVKVGLRYGSSVMSSANLENDEGSGYEFGYFEDDRTFVSLGETDETAITMEPAGRDGIQVTITGTDRVLYESREDALAVMPQGRDPVTWFRGNRYRGGFEYTVSGGGLQVVNVVDLEDYVKGVLPSEMPGNWELEALKAQAVCARTFACLTTKHLSAYGFDVCSSTDCQAYSGIGEATSATDRAVEETEGECLYYDGELAQAYYDQHGEELVNVPAAERQEKLAQFGLTFSDVADNCPRQERTLAACRRVLDFARTQPELLKRVEDTGKLPMGELSAGSGTDKKTMERHRKYLVAILLAFTNGYEIIRGHLCQLAPAKGGSTT